MALVIWSSAMETHLPLLTRPPSYPGPPTQQHYSFANDHPLVASKGDLDASANEARKTLADHHANTASPDDGQEANKNGGGERWDANNQDEGGRVDRSDTSDAINKHLNTGSKIAATDNSPPPNAFKFKPVVLHSPHDPVPMALVNRAPRGKSGHGDVYVPQNQAWLAAFRFAKRHAFVQTPTFNAPPIVEAALSACRRGILVEIYADLGFNDEGELLPFQGGTDQMVANGMYKNLEPEHKDNLRWYWYTGKDQRSPLNAKDKSRNCHVKLMIADEHIIVQGNGNQDTQSWYHSQEINCPGRFSNFIEGDQRSD